MKKNYKILVSIIAVVSVTAAIEIYKLADAGGLGWAISLIVTLGVLLFFVALRAHVRALGRPLTVSDIKNNIPIRIVQHIHDLVDNHSKPHTSVWIIEFQNGDHVILHLWPGYKLEEMKSYHYDSSAKTFTEV